MREGTIARSYAEALFALGERHGQQEAFAEAVDQVAALFESEPRLRTFLETPKVEPADKKGVLRQVFGGRVPPLFLNFLMLLVDKRRQRLIGEVAREYHALLDEHLGRVHVQVTLAREPDEEMKRELTDRLTRIMGKTVIPHVQVNPQILGGVVIRSGDRVFDGSLRRRLMTLRRRLVQAELPAGS